MRTASSGEPRRLRRAPRVYLGPPSGEQLEAALASTWARRLTGLAGLATAPPPALLIPHCRSVHTWGMRFTLDIVFLEWPPTRAVAAVAEVHYGVRPFRFVAAARRNGSVAALELDAGRAARLGLSGAGAAVTVTYR